MAARKDLPRLAYSPEEAADVLGVSRRFLYDHIGPELRWVRVGRRKLVSHTELEKWLDRNSARTLG
jgi:excisionase family DNA binding protein